MWEDQYMAANPHDRTNVKEFMSYQQYRVRQVADAGRLQEEESKFEVAEDKYSMIKKIGAAQREAYLGIYNKYLEGIKEGKVNHAVKTDKDFYDLFKNWEIKDRVDKNKYPHMYSLVEAEHKKKVLKQSSPELADLYEPFIDHAKLAEERKRFAEENRPKVNNVLEAYETNTGLAEKARLDYTERKMQMNEYYDALLRESGHKTLNELLETLDQREANAYRDELQNQLDSIEKTEKEFYENHGQTFFMDKHLMPFNQTAIEAPMGTRIRPLAEGQDATLVQKEFSTDAHTQKMLQLDEKIKAELGLTDQKLLEGLDLGVREPLSAKEQEDIQKQMEEDPEEVGPLYRVRHNVELIENKMLRNIQNHLAETKYQIPTILQELGHDKDYQIALKRRNMQVFDEENYHKVADITTKSAMSTLELEERLHDENEAKQAWIASSLMQRSNYLKMVITGDEIKQVYKSLKREKEATSDEALNKLHEDLELAEQRVKDKYLRELSQEETNQEP